MPSIRRRAASLLLAVIVSGLGALPGPLPTVQPAAAGCDPASGGENSAGTDCKLPGNSVDPPGTNKGGRSNCVIGAWPWTDPKDGLKVKWTNSILDESGPTLPSLDPIYTGMRQVAMQAWTGSGQYTSSIYWGGQQVYADLVAAALQIRPGTRYDGSAGWVLAFSTSSDRTQTYFDGAKSLPSGTSGLVAGSFYATRYTWGPRSGEVWYELHATPGSTKAKVWADGDEPVLAAPLGAEFAFLPSPSRVRSMIEDEIGDTLLHGDSVDLRRLVFKNSYVADNWSTAAPYAIRQAIKASYVPGLPVIVEVQTPGATKWTKVTSTSSTAFPPSTKWRAWLGFQNRQHVAASEDDVLAGFHQVVKDLLETKPSDPARYSGRTRYTGKFYFPAFANLANPAGPADCGGDTLFKITVSGKSLAFTRDTSGSYATAGNAAWKGCRTTGLNSSTRLLSYISAPAACFLFWIPVLQDPPAIHIPSWDDGQAVGFRDVLFKVDGQAPVVPVGSSVRFTPISTAWIPGASSNLKIEAPAGTVSPGEKVSINVTQVGVTATVGNRILAARAYNPKDPAGGYTFEVPFGRTPSSRLQDAECAKAYKSGGEANLERVCGIVFRSLDGKTSYSAPRYRVRLHTWWDGLVRYPRPGADYYCGVFVAALPGDDEPCVVFDKSLWWHIAPFPASGTWAPDYGPAVVLPNHAIGSDGKALAGWPTFTAASPSARNSASGLKGSPLWDASKRTSYSTNFDIAVYQVQPVP